MTKFLGNSAICMCPHGGQLKFMVTQQSSDGMDGKNITMKDFQNATIVGCAMPPPPAGMSPCMKVLTAVDPIGMAMKVDGSQVVTEMVIAFTDKGWPIMVVNPGMSAMSWKISPNAPSTKKAEFSQGSVQKQSGLGIGEGTTGSSSSKTWKDVVSAYWITDFLRREQKAILAGTTVGFSDGTAATLMIYEFDLEGNHSFVDRVGGTVKKDQVEAEWVFDYKKDVAELPDMFEGDEFYSAPSYYFELKVGGKTAQSGLIEFRDSIEIDVTDENDDARANAVYTAYFADGSSTVGTVDANGNLKLEDIPPGNVHLEFSVALKTQNLTSASWSNAFLRRNEEIELIAETHEFPDETPATFTLYKVIQHADPEYITELPSTVNSNKAKANWSFEYQGDLSELPSIAHGDESYLAPRYYFEVNIGGQSLNSELIEFRDSLELTLINQNDEPLSQLAFTIHFADGSSEQLMTDELGFVELKDIPPGRVKLDFSGGIAPDDDTPTENDPSDEIPENDTPIEDNPGTGPEEDEDPAGDNDDCDKVTFPSGESLCIVTDQATDSENDEHWDAFADRFGLTPGPLLDCRGKGDMMLSANFSVREFTKGGDYARIDPDLIRKLQILRDNVGSISVNSGYRSWEYNKELYSRRGQTPTKSPHTHGIAADIQVAGMSAEDLAKRAIDAFGCNMGIGLIMGERSIHVDTRSTWSTWNYGGQASIDAEAEVRRYRHEQC